MNDTSSTAHATLDRPAHCARTEGSIDKPIRFEPPVFAAALSRRLYAAGLPVTPERAMSFAEALILIGPLSRSRLYCAARTVFVSAPGQLAQFDRVFASVFGGCSDEPGERVRQAEEAQMR